MISETLQNLISKLSNISDPNEVLQTLIVKDIKQVIYHGDQSIAAVERTYGSEFVIALVAGMSQTITMLQSGDATAKATAIYLQVYFDRLTKGNGLDFSSDTVQARLDSLSSILTQDIVDKLKNIGATFTSQWLQATSDPEPSIEEVTEAIAIEQQRRATKAWVAYVRAILANDGNGKTISELKNLIAERE